MRAALLLHRLAILNMTILMVYMQKEMNPVTICTAFGLAYTISMSYLAFNCFSTGKQSTPMVQATCAMAVGMLALNFTAAGEKDKKSA